MEDEKKYGFQTVGQASVIWERFIEKAKGRGIKARKSEKDPADTPVLGQEERNQIISEALLLVPKRFWDTKLEEITPKKYFILNAIKNPEVLARLVQTVEQIERGKGQERVM